MAASDSTPSPAPKNQRREIVAWCVYDWANSAYSTVSITVLMGYLTTELALPDKMGALIWGWGIGVTMILTAFLSPVLGAIADARNNKRMWLAITTLLGAGSCVLMFFAKPDNPWFFVVLFILANLGYEQAWGFYNSFLPVIADDDYMSRVSSWGFGAGYVGGGLLLLVNILIFALGDQLGLPSEDGFRFRLGLSVMGLWWLGFSIPTLLVLKDRSTRTVEPQSILTSARLGLAEVWRTLTHLRHYRMLVVFLIGFLIYNDGVQTMITQAGVFATAVLEMTTQELGGVILMIQFVALPGALIVGWTADRIGQKTALMICLAIWITLLGLSFFITEKWQFWTMAAFSALVLGGTQSVSRTIMGLMTPEARSAEFFGFFNLSGKAASMLGPIVFSTTMYATGSPHMAILSLLIFFLLGAAIVAPLNIAKGQQQAGKGGGSG